MSFIPVIGNKNGEYANSAMSYFRHWCVSVHNKTTVSKVRCKYFSTCILKHGQNSTVYAGLSCH